MKAIRLLILVLGILNFGAVTMAADVHMNPGDTITLQPGTFTTVTCGTGQQPITCISDCVKRDSLMTCFEYGPDFCGVNPRCIPHCIKRDSQNNCFQYDVDICTANQ